MTAIRIREPGGPGVLVSEQVPIPQPGPGEVLIRVAAAGVNRADVVQRLGKYPMPPGVSPSYPGLEVSGTVVETGGGLNRWRAGDEVCALIVGGGYAEYVIAPAAQCMAIPENVTLADAAGLPEAFCTVWTNVFERGQLKPGEFFLMQGGSSGVGVAATQLASAMGSTVLATAGTEEKCEACRSLGAARAINYRTEDFQEVVRDFTGGTGVNVILDMVGGPYIQREIEIMAKGGRLVIIATMGGARAVADFQMIERKHLTVTGSTLRSRSVVEKAAICQALEAQAWPHFSTGRVRSVTYRTFPLAQARQAHELLETSSHVGKILLIP